MKNILIVTTGGTIDKSYIETEEKLKNIKSLIEEQVSQIRHCKNIDFHHHIQIDSNQMTDSIRSKIFKVIENNKNKYNGFMITHGTNTLIETAKFIQFHAKKIKLIKPIVITGAMRPLSVKGSDGYQNLIESLLVFEWLKLSKQNVHIVMHNQIFNPVNCKKNYQKMIFETIE